MKLNKVISQNINTKNIVEKTQKFLEPVTQKFDTQEIFSNISSARMHLELNAEDMLPNEYIAARSYISSLEMDELIASEMRMIK